MWVLLWTLGKLPELPWPDSMCDTQQLMEQVVPARKEPHFILDAKLKSKSEILDVQELTM
jgi:hypothetical protein